MKTHYHSRIKMDDPIGKALNEELVRRLSDFRVAHRYSHNTMANLIRDLLAERLEQLAAEPGDTGHGP